MKIKGAITSILSTLYGSLFWDKVADNEIIAHNILALIFGVILQQCVKTMMKKNQKENEKKNCPMFSTNKDVI